MIKFMRSAVVVVACLFAGVGAWGAKVAVGPNPVYASELFGEGHAAISYPEGMNPVVTLTIPGNYDARDAAGADTDDTADDRDACTAFSHNGSVEVTFTLLAGAFDANVTGLMWDANAAAANTADPVAAPATVATIESGGRKGDNSITIKIEEAANEGPVADGNTARLATSAAPADVKACMAADTNPPQTISFSLPKLSGLQALAGANIADDKKDNDEKTAYMRAESRIISGTFTDGFLTGAPPHFVAPVVKARDSLTLSITPKASMKTIAIKDDADKGLMAFKSVKEKNKEGYVELATVTVTTKQMAAAAMAAVKAEETYRFTAAGDAATISTIAKAAKAATFHELYDLDGESIDEGLRGTLTVNAMGTRDLFNEDDMLFIDYDKNGKMGSGEGIAIDGNMGMGDALSVDPDKSDSFDKGGTGVFKVYYMPGGKGDIKHGAMINLTAMVDYSDPTAIDEAPAKSATTLNFDGVGNAVMAYAIPHSTNGTGDKANVRVRCEASTGCRVFAECWDDMGNRGFGEGPMIAGNNVMVANAEAVEMITGLEPTSRLSCRVLSAGAVTVQQLTRDGNSGTLVNNTYVGQ
jgi:hypothetical protein